MSREKFSKRDRRAFKSAPFQDPRQYPPPSTETWHAIGATAPLSCQLAAQQQPARIVRRAQRRAMQ
jgi:hypothetical protein